MKESISILLGEEPEEELKTKLKNIVNTHLGFDAELHHLHIHNYGNHSELTFHIKLDPKLTLVEAHNIADDIEELIKQQMNFIATIHIEPTS